MGLQYIHPPRPHARPVDRFPDAPVEGHGPSVQLLRIESRILAVGAVLAFALAVVGGYLLDGARGLALGLVLFSAYFLLGWWPYFAARHYRRRSHEDE